MEDKMNERDDNYKEMVVKLIIVLACGNTERIVSNRPTETSGKLDSDNEQS